MITLDRVHKSFPMGDVTVEALRDVSMTIRAGEFLVMVGPSGSGKTTLLNLLGGLDQPTNGSVLFEGRDLARYSNSELTRYRRATVGFVFQFYNLIPNLTAAENVMVATDVVERPMSVDDALARVGMSERSRHFPAQMSGGEQQRVSIARAIAKNPAMLLCDEPTGALDFDTGKQVLRTLVDLRNELGKTVVIITHNSAIAPIADRVVRLRSGSIVEVHENPTPKQPEEIVW